jgi:hypothetical protein
MQFLRHLIARVKAWREDRRVRRRIVTPLFANFVHFGGTIHRDVTPHGVRVYSLCGCCGARLQASATLCEECAQKQSRARPY